MVATRSRKAAKVFMVIVRGLLEMLSRRFLEGGIFIVQWAEPQTVLQRMLKTRKKTRKQSDKLSVTHTHNDKQETP